MCACGRERLTKSNDIVHVLKGDDTMMEAQYKETGDLQCTRWERGMDHPEEAQWF